MTERHSTHSSVSGLLLVLFAVLTSTSLQAQADLAPALSVDSVLARYKRNPGGNLESSHLHHLLRYTNSSARRDSLLNGLEHLALSADDARLRSSAALWLASMGEADAPLPRQGIVARLGRIYSANEAWLVRYTIQQQLPVQAERRTAAALLRSIALQPDTSSDPRVGDMGDLRFEALYRLSEMGEEGRAVLQTMHRNGEVRSPHVRRQLGQMARHGFPVRDLARQRQQP